MNDKRDLYRPKLNPNTFHKKRNIAVIINSTTVPTCSLFFGGFSNRAAHFSISQKSFTRKNLVHRIRCYYLLHEVT